MGGRHGAVQGELAGWDRLGRDLPGDGRPEKDPSLATLYVRVAEVEERHLAFWKSQLRAAGVEPGARSPVHCGHLKSDEVWTPVWTRTPQSRTSTPLGVLLFAGVESSDVLPSTMRPRRIRAGRVGKPIGSAAAPSGVPEARPRPSNGPQRVQTRHCGSSASAGVAAPGLRWDHRGRPSTLFGLGDPRRSCGGT